MTHPENDIENLESQVPALSASAFSEARSQALKSGYSVYERNQEAIYEVFPDGTRRFIKNTDPPLHKPAGTTVEIP